MDMGAGPPGLLFLFGMWSVMMVAMMLPSATPMILLVGAVARRRGAAGPAVHTGLFTAGYFLLWIGFSAVAALAQWLLHRAALLTPAMASASPVLSGLVLLTAGVYQWLPLKRACLGHCRSPLHFLGAEWREGRAGALRMGARHGLFCVGCCWATMTLLFVGGVMRLPWIVALAALVLLEKLGPRGATLARAAGVVFAGWGLYLLVERLT